MLEEREGRKGEDRHLGMKIKDGTRDREKAINNREGKRNSHKQKWDRHGKMEQVHRRLRRSALPTSCPRAGGLSAAR